MANGGILVLATALACYLPRYSLELEMTRETDPSFGGALREIKIRPVVMGDPDIMV